MITQRVVLIVLILASPCFTLYDRPASSSTQSHTGRLVRREARGVLDDAKRVLVDAGIHGSLLVEPRKTVHVNMPDRSLASTNHLAAHDEAGGIRTAQDLATLIQEGEAREDAWAADNVPNNATRIQHDDICQQARQFTWACETLDRATMLKIQLGHEDKLCTEKGAISLAEAANRSAEYIMTPFWMLQSQRLLAHMRYRCAYFVESYHDAHLDPRLFSFFEQLNPVQNRPFTLAALNMLNTLPENEKHRWFASMYYKDDPVKTIPCNPVDYAGYVDNKTPPAEIPLSFEALGHVAPVFGFEKSYGIDVSKLGAIVEYGPGTGGYAGQLPKLGFAGRHVTFDGPVQLLAQRAWRKAAKRPHCPFGSLGEGTPLGQHPFKIPGCKNITSPGVVWQTAGVSELRAALTALPPAGNTSGAGLFMATYSMSESPMPIRDQILDVLAESPAISHILIAYSPGLQYLEIQDNEGYKSNEEYFDTALSKRGMQPCRFLMKAFGRSDWLLMATKDGKAVPCKKIAGCTPASNFTCVGGSTPPAGPQATPTSATTLAATQVATSAATSAATPAVAPTRPFTLY